jgi:DNA-binding transcriptional ArsR family regulator
VTAGAGQASEQLLKAIAHPLRHRILVAIDAEESSPNLVAQRLGEPLGRVSHHVRVLARLGAIELVRTEPRRGAVEHFYRAAVRPWFDDETWSRLPRSARRTLFGQPLERLLTDIPAAARGTGFDHLKAHVSYTELELDEEGMTAVSELLTETLERALAIREAAARRLADGGEPLRTELGIVHFERA